MEQKKTLWIIAASGVFLMVVIGAALLLNAPSSSAPATASITTIDKTPVTAKADENVITPVTTPLSEQALDSNTLAFQQLEEGRTAAANDAVAVTGNAGNTNNAANAEQTNASEAAAIASAESGTPADNTTNIQLKTTGASGNVTATSRAGQEALAAASSKTSPSTIYTDKPGTSSAAKNGTAASGTSTVASTKTGSASNVAAAKAAPAKTASVVSTKYWVQAASFTNKKSADNARTALDDNKIPAEVFTYKDNKDTMFYRVRVGPYTTKSEAEYWQTRICKIDLFKNTQSYVTATKS